MNIKYLPNELIDLILEYNGNIKKRLGKYMNQLNLKDHKYNLLKENIRKKIIIINEFHKEIYFIIDRQSKLKVLLNFLYPNKYYGKYSKRIIYKTIHQLVPPYKTYYYYIWEEFSLTGPEL